MQYFNGYSYRMPRYSDQSLMQMPASPVQMPQNMLPGGVQGMPVQQTVQTVQTDMHELTSHFKPCSCVPPMVDMTPYKYPDNLRAALSLLQEAVAGESEDRLFYEYLLSAAPNDAEKEIITGIRNDEIGHSALFRQVYYMITQRVLPEPKEEKFEKPSSYCEGIMRAIMGEQRAVSKYRRILFALQDRILINILTEIITDEIRHGSLYNYLYSKNSCKA